MRVSIALAAVCLAGSASAYVWPFEEFLACYRDAEEARREYRKCNGGTSVWAFNDFFYCFTRQGGRQFTCPDLPTPTPSASPSSSSTVPSATPSPGNFIDWRTWKANGVNLGAWLEKEKNHDTDWWNDVGGEAVNDEWSLCELLGPECGPIFEGRYATFINTSTIDQLADVGVNTLRIPTTYAAWVEVPGSQLWAGDQQVWLKIITDYAISQYGMHIIIDIHSLPGGVNNLDIGEAFGHLDWFNNATNLAYSYDAVEAVLKFIQDSGRPESFTLSPINEAADDLSKFGTADGLTQQGANYVLAYIKECLARIAAVDTRIPLMLNDNFKGAAFWEPYFEASTNLVIDTHVYYFAAGGIYSNYVNFAACGQAKFIANATKFPVFVGEWSLETQYNNTLANRQEIFNTQRYAWMHYLAGGAFWTAKSISSAPVDGEGTRQDYWSYTDLIFDEVITPPTEEVYCVEETQDA